MSNLPEQTLEEHRPPATNQNPNDNINNNNQQHQLQQQRDQAQEWETMARAWLTAFPEAKAVSESQVDAWIDSNYSTLPADLQSMPRSELIDRLLSIQNYMKLPNQKEKEGNSVEIPARFQRTDQWIPVYAWLENLDQDEVVKSKDISDWLTANSQVKDQLCSRHSRYHLMHYIKKCHLKILKRRERKGCKQMSNEAAALPNKETSLTVHKSVVPKQPAPPPSIPVNLIPKDSELYVSKRNEALRKHEILVELEKKLSPIFSKRQDVNSS